MSTRIEWTDETWNPVTGCTKVSAGCKNCYAERLSERFRGTKGHHFERGFDLVLRPERLDIPYRWRRPRRVFVCSMGDLFHPQVPFGFISAVFRTAMFTPQHTYQVLTKRPEVAADYFRHLAREKPKHGPAGGERILGNRWPLPNVWIGTSVEDQAMADVRIPKLLRLPARRRFLSCEPLLGPVSLGLFGTIAGDPYHQVRDELDWVIVGGESGLRARPMHPDWVRSIRDQCVDAEVPFFFKQWGQWVDAGVVPVGQWAGRSPRHHEWPDGSGRVMSRVSKRAAGRDLDGRTWDEFPGGTG